MTSAERARVERFGDLGAGLRQASDWYLWGPYLSERQWGTVREDYSEDGDAWAYFPHDHARSRAYRWGEDGMAGFCDVEQRLCLGLALWNGRDPILKERMFGLTGAEANHGEDVKEHWWYLDAIPSHAWNRWRYHYPQRAFPYGDLLAENGRRGKLDPEYELLDTGVFDDDRYWICEVDYAKANPDDLLMTVRVTNAGPEADTVHLLPSVWFRNTWSWDLDAREARPAPGGRSDRRTSSTRSSVSSSCSPALRRTDRRPRRCSARTRPTRRGCTATRRRSRIPRTRSTIASSTATPTPSTPTAPAPRRRCGTSSRSLPGPPWRSSCACDRRARHRRSPPQRSAPSSTRSSPSATPRPTSSTPSWTPADATADSVAGHAPGVLRDALEQAAVRLRRRSLAGRRPHPADAAGLAPHRTQLALAALRGVRHHVDARQVGVPVVRRVGPRVPLRRARPRRSGVRQVPAAADLP